MSFHKQILDIDPAAEAERIVMALRQIVRQKLRRSGAVVAFLLCGIGLKLFLP